MEKEDKYYKLLSEAGLFFHGPNKGSFILPPQGYLLWKNIQNSLDKKFATRGVKNVFVPTLIPLTLLEKEKQHISGFSPECYYVEKIGTKKLENPLVLRPTSEVLFYDWYRQILHSYQQLPLLYNQWCSVFRAEKNTNPFFRNTEFYWQEGHTIHSNEKEARELVLNILADYQDYAEKILNLAVIVGRKTEGEKFAGALETYTIEHLLPDGQCLQLATSHYFGDSFCQLMQIKFHNKNNRIQYPFSTSWGTSTRAIGAIAKTHNDNWGVMLPFVIAPTQIAFILVGESPELTDYYQEIYGLLNNVYRCQLYNKNSRVNLNVLQADKEGCPLKIILGQEEIKKREITLIRRDNIERKITISLQDNKVEKKYIPTFTKYVDELNKIEDNPEVKKELAEERIINSYKNGEKTGKIFRVISKEIKEFQAYLYQKSADFRDSHIYPINEYSILTQKIQGGTRGLFLIPFCNRLECEATISNQVPAYSVRCIKSEQSILEQVKCLFCQSLTTIRVYLGRSY